MLVQLHGYFRADRLTVEARHQPVSTGLRRLVCFVEVQLQRVKEVRFPPVCHLEFGFEDVRGRFPGSAVVVISRLVCTSPTLRCRRHPAGFHARDRQPVRSECLEVPGSVRVPVALELTDGMTADPFRQVRG